MCVCACMHVRSCVCVYMCVCCCCLVASTTLSSLMTCVPALKYVFSHSCLLFGVCTRACFIICKCVYYFQVCVSPAGMRVDACKPARLPLMQVNESLLKLWLIWCWLSESGLDQLLVDVTAGLLNDQRFIDPKAKHLNLKRKSVKINKAMLLFTVRVWLSGVAQKPWCYNTGMLVCVCVCLGFCITPICLSMAAFRCTYSSRAHVPDVIGLFYVNVLRLSFTHTTHILVPLSLWGLSLLYAVLLERLPSRVTG